MPDLIWSCRCGAMHGHLTVSRGGGTPIICHCESCVRAQRYFGAQATAADGVALYQTTPDRFRIAAGSEHLALARLTPGGSYRWFAGCCNTQLGITATTPRFAFFSAVQSILHTPEPLGPARAHAFVPKAGAGTTHTGMTAPILALLRRSLAALTSGSWRDTPFFDPNTRKPVVAPELLPKGSGRP